MQLFARLFACELVVGIITSSALLISLSLSLLVFSYSLELSICADDNNHELVIYQKLKVWRQTELDDLAALSSRSSHCETDE